MGESIDDQTIDVEINDNFKCFINYKIDFFMKSSILFDKCILNNVNKENLDTEKTRLESSISNNKIYSIIGAVARFFGLIVGHISGFFRMFKR